MKLYYLDRTDLQNNSLSVKYNRFPHFLKLWHYHEQLELVLILKSIGTRFVGNNIEQFKEGELILLGKDLPHMWLNDKQYFQGDSELIAEAIAIHFKENFLCNAFAEVPEFHLLAQLLEKAKRGLKFTGDISEVKQKIKAMVEMSEFERVLKLLEILNCLAKQEVTYLSSEGFVETFANSRRGNMDEVYSYIFKNFKQQITLNEVAKIINMHPTAFSRFFKKVNQKTFSRYLNEIRIGFACKLILEQRYAMTTICYESGFNNISNFNRQFKAITLKSPTEYLANHLKIYS